MPSSTRHLLRDVRRSYTGEDKIAAKAGLGRHCLGLDRCTPEQRRFRALLALNLFNEYSTDIRGRDIYCAYGFLSYTMIASPRYNQMVFFVPSAVRNAFGRLIASRNDLRLGMPGLRLVAGDGFDTFHAIHLPTGARVVFAARSDFEPVEAILRSARNLDGRYPDSFPRSVVPLSADEQTALDRVPTMTAEIETLLAALVTRISARDPRRSWHVGNWWGDPLSRPEPAGRGHDRTSCLWGAGHRWTLHWNRDPYPEDLVACLTAPEVGVARATAIEDGDGWTIRLGESSLYLRYGEVA